MLGALRDADVGRREQLLDKDNLRARLRGVAYQRLGAVGICGQVPRAGELRGGKGDVAHGLLSQHEDGQDVFRSACALQSAGVKTNVCARMPKSVLQASGPSDGWFR
jgi:hypothetical protein